jgi:hypothetical protein
MVAVRFVTPGGEKTNHGAKGEFLSAVLSSTTTGRYEAK